MRIKTITCDDVYNAGASLQAYALVTYLRSLGHEAEIIDYVTKLKSLTQASGFFNREFEAYEELPEFLKDKVIAENKVE